MGAHIHETDFDVVIVGAGISGINAAYRIQIQLPVGTTYTILEARDNIGGTWDLFKYPGIRSDSDLYTFGFPWKPWMSERCIAEGPAIVNYMKEAAASEHIDEHIQFRHRVQTASWSSELQKWRLEISAGEAETPKTLYANFLIMGTGYYDYEEPLSATIPGLDSFQGEVVHPQFWPADLDYTNRRIVVIGSGATAITLLPSLADRAAHVTMLQRSPSYIVKQELVNGLDNSIRSFLPEAAAYRIIRWRHLFMTYLFFFFCRAFPQKARSLLRGGTEKEPPPHHRLRPALQPEIQPVGPAPLLLPGRRLLRRAAQRQSQRRDRHDRQRHVDRHHARLRHDARMRPDHHGDGAEATAGRRRTVRGRRSRRGAGGQAAVAGRAAAGRAQRGVRAGLRQRGVDAGRGRRGAAGRAPAAPHARGRRDELRAAPARRRGAAGAVLEAQQRVCR